ncbi:hypothetical protein HAX54_033295 [Datura stramonium]|uniref:Uncharacterized protein n=1 Tax=Datura stramonium TaxID=4076 RepID=A0ABS8SDH6_DATST|nr:hypothetical protein [Datura stramonium]
MRLESSRFSSFRVDGAFTGSVIWLQVNWSLAYVIAVIESKWGFETLRRSAYLVKGKRWVALSMMLIHGLLMGFIVVWGSIYLVLMDPVKDSAGPVLGFMMMNQYLVGNVALYMYCNDFNGEEFADASSQVTGTGEYVSALDD